MSNAPSKRPEVIYDVIVSQSLREDGRWQITFDFASSQRDHSEQDTQEGETPWTEEEWIAASSDLDTFIKSWGSKDKWGSPTFIIQRKPFTDEEN